MTARGPVFTVAAQEIVETIFDISERKLVRDLVADYEKLVLPKKGGK